MVGFIEAIPFEDDTGWEKYAANLTAAFGAHCKWLISHLLPRFETMPAGLAEIFIRRHISNHLLQKAAQRRGGSCVPTKFNQNVYYS